LKKTTTMHEIRKGPQLGLFVSRSLPYARDDSANRRAVNAITAGQPRKGLAITWHPFGGAFNGSSSTKVDIEHTEKADDRFFHLQPTSGCLLRV
jgi:hypothetical protein